MMIDAAAKDRRRLRPCTPYRPVNVAIAALALTALTAQTHAQFGTGRLDWQLSTDEGSTWQGGRVEVPLSTTGIRVRLLASWSADAGYAFAGTQFDAVITGLNAGGNDTVLNPSRPFTFDSGAQQTIVSTRFGNQIKIDDSRDTNPPGVGVRGVFPGQRPENFAEGRFTAGQPVSIFEYTLRLDGTPGTRRIDGEPITGPIGFPCWSVRIYTSPIGAQIALNGGPSCDRNSLTYAPASLVIIPTPATATLLAVAVVAHSRRRGN
jgi:hypothetical protein